MVDQQQNDNPVLRFGVMAFYFAVALSFPVVLLLFKGCFGSDRASDAVLEARAARVAVAAGETQPGVSAASLAAVSGEVLEKLSANRGVVTSVVIPGSPTQLAGDDAAKPTANSTDGSADSADSNKVQGARQ